MATITFKIGMIVAPTILFGEFGNTFTVDETMIDQNITIKCVDRYHTRGDYTAEMPLVVYCEWCFIPPRKVRNVLDNTLSFNRVRICQFHEFSISDSVTP